MEVTIIHKFSIDSGASTLYYALSGFANDRNLNHFSIDEYNGYLRIATTTGRDPDPQVHSSLSTLKQMDCQLVVAGFYDHIAPTEDIRSVRFDGDTVFIVTFEKTDPLFAFDLSDPEDAVFSGELKIPGFSTYMYIMDVKRSIMMSDADTDYVFPVTGDSIHVGSISESGMGQWFNMNIGWS